MTFLGKFEKTVKDKVAENILSHLPPGSLLYLNSDHEGNTKIRVECVDPLDGLTHFYCELYGCGEIPDYDGYGLRAKRVIEEKIRLHHEQHHDDNKNF